MSDTMDRWKRETSNTLAALQAQLAEHEAATEAAMQAIRRHTEAAEKLAANIEVIRAALATAGWTGLREPVLLAAAVTAPLHPVPRHARNSRLTLRPPAPPLPPSRPGRTIGSGSIRPRAIVGGTIG